MIGAFFMTITECLYCGYTVTNEGGHPLSCKKCYSELRYLKIKTIDPSSVDYYKKELKKTEIDTYLSSDEFYYGNKKVQKTS